MRRVLVFLDFEAQKWIDWLKVKISHPSSDLEQDEGTVAYATEQAFLRKDLKDYFKALWADVPRFIAICDTAVV